MIVRAAIQGPSEAERSTGNRGHSWLPGGSLSPRQNDRGIQIDGSDQAQRPGANEGTRTDRSPGRKSDECACGCAGRTQDSEACELNAQLRIHPKWPVDFLIDNPPERTAATSATRNESPSTRPERGVGRVVRNARERRIFAIVTTEWIKLFAHEKRHYRPAGLRRYRQLEQSSRGDARELAFPLDGALHWIRRTIATAYFRSPGSAPSGPTRRYIARRRGMIRRWTLPHSRR